MHTESIVEKVGEGTNTKTRQNELTTAQATADKHTLAKVTQTTRTRNHNPMTRNQNIPIAWAFMLTARGAGQYYESEDRDLI